MATDYATAAELEAYLGITGDTSQDVQFGLAITAASAGIDRATNRTFGPAAATAASSTLAGGNAIGDKTLNFVSAAGFTAGADFQVDVNTYTTTLAEVRHITSINVNTVTFDLPLTIAHSGGVAVKTVVPRYFTRYKDEHEPQLPWDYNLLPLETFFRQIPRVQIDDLFDVSSVVVQDRISGAPIGLDRYWPYNAVSRTRPFTAIEFVDGTLLPRGRGNVLVAANFGWTSIPTGIHLACLLQASRYYKRKDSPYGIAGDIAMGSGMRLLNKLDPDVDQMCADFRRPWAAA